MEKSPARRKLASEIARSAAENAGSSFDLDLELEKSGTEYLEASERECGEKPEPGRLAAECAKLDPSEDRQLAEEGLSPGHRSGVLKNY